MNAQTVLVLLLAAVCLVAAKPTSIREFLRALQEEIDAENAAEESSEKREVVAVPPGQSAEKKSYASGGPINHVFQASGGPIPGISQNVARQQGSSGVGCALLNLAGQQWVSHPSGYGNNERWCITLGGTYNYVMIDELDVEVSSNCAYDRVTFRGSDGSELWYCGNMRGVRVDLNTPIEVHFRSDGSVTGDGFKLRTMI